MLENPLASRCSVFLTLLGYPDLGFPCFSTDVRQLAGNSSKEAWPATPIMVAFSQYDTCSPYIRSELQPKLSRPFLVQLPDVHVPQFFYQRRNYLM
jgi:hypothetical protein